MIAEVGGELGAVDLPAFDGPERARRARGEFQLVEATGRDAFEFGEAGLEAQAVAVAVFHLHAPGEQGARQQAGAEDERG